MCYWFLNVDVPAQYEYASSHPLLYLVGGGEEEEDSDSEGGRKSI